MSRLSAALLGSVVATVTVGCSGLVMSSTAPVGPPNITISPNSGTPGTQVIINGANFVSGATVQFGTTLGTGTTFVSASQLTTSVPPIAVGTYDVVVTNPDTSTATLPSGFQVVAAVSLLSGMTPASFVVPPNSGESSIGIPRGFTGRAYGATALLYNQDIGGNLHFECTATAFEHDGKIYHFASDAHCVSKDAGTADANDTSIVATDRVLYLTFDESQQKIFFRVKVIALGNRKDGEDFAVLEATIDRKIPVIPLGDEGKETIGSRVINIASPLGVGRQVFSGYISGPEMNRPGTWRAFWAQVPIQGGSSGSAIISPKQKAIIGFVTDGIYSTSMITPSAGCLPASRFKEFWRRAKEAHWPK